MRQRPGHGAHDLQTVAASPVHRLPFSVDGNESPLLGRCLAVFDCTGHVLDSSNVVELDDFIPMIPLQLLRVTASLKVVRAADRHDTTGEDHQL